MKKFITFICMALIAVSAVFAEDERVLVVKPVMTTRMDTPTDWGGLAATAMADPKYKMTKVEGYDNLYSCTISLDAYFKSNKWKSGYGESYDPENPNEGWSNAHRFVAVYQDEYGDQEDKNNPNAAAKSQTFIIEEDGTEVTFYALVQDDGVIRSCSDAQTTSITIQNNITGTLDISPAIGKTSAQAAVEINGNGKIETVVSAHFLNPNGDTKKYAVYSRGKHVIEFDFLTLTYGIYKVLDEIISPTFKIGDNISMAAPETSEYVGAFTADSPFSFAGSIVATATEAVNLSLVEANMYYQLIPEDETDALEVTVPLSTSSSGSQTSATWTNDALNLSEGLENGNYTLKVRFETICVSDTISLNNDESDYVITFAVYNNLALNTLEVSEGTLSPDFDLATTLYSVDVEKDIASIILSATADEGMIVDGTGEKELNFGVNSFDITVNPDGVDDAIRTYTIEVTRAKSTDATLKSLIVSEGELTPVFDPETLEYTVDVEAEVRSILIDAEVADEYASAIGTGEFDLNVGENVFEITVTAQDEVSKQTYKITVTKQKSSDTTLGILTVSDGELEPAFDPEIISYSVIVEENISSVVIGAVAAHEKASVEGDGGFALVFGPNPFDIVVTAEDGSTKIYTITVTRKQNTGIGNVSSNDIIIRTANGTIDVFFEGTAIVKLYSIAGQLIKQTVAAGSFSETVQQGLYILMIDNAVYKLTVNN